MWGLKTGADLAFGIKAAADSKITSDALEFTDESKSIRKRIYLLFILLGILSYVISHSHSSLSGQLTGKTWSKSHHCYVIFHSEQRCYQRDYLSLLTSKSWNTTPCKMNVSKSCLSCVIVCCMTWLQMIPKSLIRFLRFSIWQLLFPTSDLLLELLPHKSWLLNELVDIHEWTCVLFCFAFLSLPHFLQTFA